MTSEWTCTSAQNRVTVLAPENTTGTRPPHPPTATTRRARPPSSATAAEGAAPDRTLPLRAAASSPPGPCACRRGCSGRGPGHTEAAPRRPDLPQALRGPRWALSALQPRLDSSTQSRAWEGRPTTQVSARGQGAHAQGSGWASWRRRLTLPCPAVSLPPSRPGKDSPAPGRFHG